MPVRKRHCLLFLLLAALVFVGLPAHAQEREPGDPCSTAGGFISSGGIENPDGNFLVCDGSIYHPVLGYSSASGWVTFGSGGLAAAPLHVWGEAIIGHRNLACSAAAEGALRYTSATDLWSFCDGTTWLDLSAGSGVGTPAGADREIQFNSGGLLFASSGFLFTSGGLLDLAGTLKIADGGEACDAAFAGAIRYDSAAARLDLCNGASWLAVNTGSGGKWLDGVESGEIYYASNVGVGTNNPAGALDVAGEIKIGNSGTACTAANEGAQRYNSAGKFMEYCDGTSWRGMGASGIKLDDLSNVNAASPAFGDCIRYRPATTSWEVEPCASSADPFTFADLYNAVRSSLIQSDIIQITGIVGTSLTSITGQGSPEYRICDDAACTTVLTNWTSADSTIQNNQYLQVRLTAADTRFVTRTATMAVGNRLDDWSVRTEGRLVFSTANTWNGNLGGTLGADAKCQAAADAAGLTGTYLAWIGGTDFYNAPAHRFSAGQDGAITITRLTTDSGAVATDWADLTDGAIGHDIDSDEYRQEHSSSVYVWTNVKLDGERKNTTFSCGDWTSTAGSGNRGRTWTSNVSWTDSSTTTCSNANRLYCFEQNDGHPQGLYFQAVDNGTPGAQTVSEIRQLTNMSAPQSVSISGAAGAEYRICSDAACSSEIQTWGSTAGTINDGEYLQLRMDAPANLGSAEATVAVGPASYTWRVYFPATVFVTSLERKGDLGGIASADFMCQSLADGAGLAGTYYAWLSDSSTSPAARFTQVAAPYVHTNGTVIADDWTDLIDGSLYDNINLNEAGGFESSTDEAWTGTNTDGSAAANHCLDWTSDSFSDDGQIGDIGEFSGIWTDYSSGSNCSTNSNHWYCFQQDLTTPPVPTKTVFVTSTTFKGGEFGGVSGADAECQSRATAAGLSGSYKAWISSSTADDPATRFTKPLANYVRVDGIVIARGWNDLIDGSVGEGGNSITMDENGASVGSAHVWTNVLSTGVSGGAAATVDCDNWTQSNSGGGSNKGRNGSTGSSSSSWTDESTDTCDTLNHLYCVEQ